MNEKFFRITHPKTPEQRAAEETAKAAAEKEAAIKAAEEAAAAAAAAASAAAAAAAAARTPKASTPERERGPAPESVRSSPGVRKSPATTSRGEHPPSPRFLTLLVLRPFWIPGNFKELLVPNTNFLLNRRLR